MRLPPPQIYISYAWGQSADSEEEKVVNSLCDRLASLGYNFVRDRDYLKYLDDLPNFLKRIGSGGYVIAIVGEKYLHSENCMIEASYMAHKGALNLRVFPITLSSLKGIYKIESRTKLITYISEHWKDKENEIKELIDKLRYTQGFISLRKGLSLVTQLTNYLSEFIHHIGTTLQISSQEHLDENFNKLIESLNARMDSDSKEFKESLGFPDLGQPYYKRFSSEYIGRKENINDVLNFLNDPEKHFMLLYGVGGMGKSHLIDICRRAYDNPFLLHEECTINYNLKSLFKTCKITYPENLDTTEERQNYFLKEFCERDIYLILDDFYETVDFEIRNMLPKIAGIPSGKILLVSRAIPKELESIGFHFDKYFIPPLNETDFNSVIKNYIIIEKKELELSPSQLHKIYEKTQGYPLGGQLIVDLLFLGEILDEILADLPKFEAELDEEGKKFSGRLLDNIFRKGNPREITLLCQFSALFGASHKGLIRQLPAFNQTAFDALVNRRKFIWKDDSDLFNSHAMIKDYAYDKLEDKKAIHQHLGKYFEGRLFANPSLDSTILESAIQHYKRVSLFDLKKIGQRVDRIFNISNVKSLIEIDVRDTIRNYNNLLDVYPEKMAYYNELGIAYRLNNQPQLAIETFLKAIKIDPTNVRILNELGITYRESGKPQLAIETFLKAIKIDPKQLPSYNELGITYRESGKPQLAIETFLKAIEIDPKQLPSYNELGITYRESGKPQLAIETFLKAIEIDPKHLPSYNELGITYRESGKPQLAIETFLKAIEIDPTNVRILNELGITYRESGKPQLAIKTFLKAIEIDPKQLPSYNELGITYRESGKPQLAIETFLKAIEIDPTNVRILNELGITYRESGKPQLAIETFLKAIKIDPKQLPSYNELGITYRESGKPQLAIETFLKAIEIDPKQLPSYNELGITYRESGKPQLAIETFLKAIEINPKQLPSYNELGITYREFGKPYDAIKICNEALNINPKHLPTVLNLLQIYIFFLPDKNKAIEYFERLNNPPYHSSFKGNRKSFKMLIVNLDEVCNTKINDFKIYDKYMFFAIQYKAYQSILHLLFTLNDKFPNNSKIVSRLGKTLSNQVILRNEEGWVFLKKSIELFKQENNQEQVEGHIYFYLYNLLNKERADLLQSELANYKPYIHNSPKYHRFLTRFYESLNKSHNEIFNEYEIAIKISETVEEKIKSVESYLDFLTRIELLEYESKIKNLKLFRDELYKEIDKENRKPSR